MRLATNLKVETRLPLYVFIALGKITMDLGRIKISRVIYSDNVTIQPLPLWSK